MTRLQEPVFLLLTLPGVVYVVLNVLAAIALAVDRSGMAGWLALLAIPFGIAGGVALIKGVGVPDRPFGSQPSQLTERQAWWRAATTRR